MKNKNVRIIVPILIVVELISIFLAFNSFNNRDINKVDFYKRNKMFAMYVKEMGETEYTEWDEDTWPSGSIYILNINNTECNDVNGNPLTIGEDIGLDYTNGRVTVTSNKTVYCTLYFDFNLTASMLDYSNIDYTECRESQCAIDELYGYFRNADGLNNQLEAGLYRYQGTTVDNYICFGTTNKDTCTSDTDKYMYRIIGVNESGQLKLIKKEALNTGYVWNTDKTTDIEWPDSDLYGGLNGSYFLTNTNYVPDSTWSNIIATTSWKYGNLKTSNASVADIATAELGFSDTVNAKIGLLYLHDYFYGIPKGKNCATKLCRANWLYLSQRGNDMSAPVGDYEWIMTRYGYVLYYNQVWKLNADSLIAETASVNELYSVRPVFYLTIGQGITSGNGTLSDPYIIGATSQHNITVNTSGFSASRNSAYPGLPINITSDNNQYEVTSFKLNGETIIGNTFTMPNENVNITDVDTKRVVFNITNSNPNVTLPNSGRVGDIVQLNSSYAITSFKLNGQTIYGDTFIMPQGNAEITDVVIYTITNSNPNVTLPNSGRAGDIITLVANSGEISSFKMNGTTIEGNSFTMPESDVTITDVEFSSDFVANYTQVDYIIGTGTQWINTGYPLWKDRNWKMEFKFDVTQHYNYNNMFGFATVTDTNNEIWINSTGQYHFRVGGSGNVTIFTAALNTPYTIIHDNTGSNLLTYVNDDLVSTLGRVTTSSNNNLGFAHRNGSQYLKGKIYYLKFWSNGDLVRDMVPAVRNSDGVAGLYDLANNEFYTNAGSGTFAVPE